MLSLKKKIAFFKRSKPFIFSVVRRSFFSRRLPAKQSCFGFISKPKLSTLRLWKSIHLLTFGQRRQHRCTHQFPWGWYTVPESRNIDLRYLKLKGLKQQTTIIGHYTLTANAQTMGSFEMISVLGKDCYIKLRGPDDGLKVHPPSWVTHLLQCYLLSFRQSYSVGWCFLQPFHSGKQRYPSFFFRKKQLLKYEWKRNLLLEWLLTS